MKKCMRRASALHGSVLHSGLVLRSGCALLGAAQWDELSLSLCLLFHSEGFLHGVLDPWVCWSGVWPNG